jgi:hypothetical protein
LFGRETSGALPHVHRSNLSRREETALVEWAYGRGKGLPLYESGTVCADSN